MALPSLPTQTPLADKAGKMSKVWLDALQQKLAQASPSGGEGWAEVTASGGTLTPDLSAGTNQEITITADTNIGAPTNYSGSVTFRLILEQDATGGHALTFDSAYVDLQHPARISGATAGASTRVILTCTVRADGTIIQTAPVMGPYSI